MLKKLFDLFLILLVLIYILFEELVWEKTAKPIVRFISKFVLKFDIFEKLILKIDNLGSYWIFPSKNISCYFCISAKASFGYFYFMVF